MISFYYFLYDGKKKIRNVLLIVVTIAVGLLLSVLGEFIQIFYPRTQSWSDVYINFAGYMAGFALALIILLIIYLVKRLNKRKTDKTLYIANE